MFVFRRNVAKQKEDTLVDGKCVATRKRDVSVDEISFKDDSGFQSEFDACTVQEELTTCCSKQSYRMVLLRYHETPEFMKGNPYVQSGYRPAEIPIALCLKSLFLWSNETINIWSHLLGLVYFILCFVYDNIFTLPRMRATWQDHFVVSIASLCFQACMLLSTCFHLFYCMSERAHRVWLTLDLLGISMSLLGIYLTGIYYSFYCFHMWHNLYLAIFFLLAFTTLAAPLHPHYTSKRFNRHRLFLYGFIAAYGILPALHWVYLNGGWESQITQKFFPNIVIVYTISFFGLCFYLLMIPERFLPGIFDYVGWSHQWWHILVLGALCYCWILVLALSWFGHYALSSV